jgi:hypothetical protein
MTRLTGLKHAMSNIESKCKAILFVLKQVWYIPFIWSLAWFSYWIFHSTIVLNTPIFQGNPVNYLGAAISIIALLIKGYSARAPIKKSLEATSKISTTLKKDFTFHKHYPGENIQKQSLLRKSAQSVQLEHLTKLKPQLKPQLKQQPPIEIRPIHKEIRINVKPVQLQPCVTSPEQRQSIAALPTQPRASGVTPPDSSNQLARARRGPSSQDPSSECLTCAHLINCKNRQKRTSELESKGDDRLPCRFAAGFSTQV